MPCAFNIQNSDATSRTVADSIPHEVTGLCNRPNPSNSNMALGLTQPLTETSTRNLPGGRGRAARKADNLTVTCEPTVWEMWEPRRLTTPCASTACYRDSFIFLLWLMTIECIYIVACTTVTRQRPRDKQIYHSRYSVRRFTNKIRFHGNYLSNVSTATNQHAIIKELLETVFSTDVSAEEL
jgi:hypothetical protein